MGGKPRETQTRNGAHICFRFYCSWRTLRALETPAAVSHAASVYVGAAQLEANASSMRAATAVFLLMVAISRAVLPLGNGTLRPLAEAWLGVGARRRVKGAGESTAASENTGGWRARMDARRRS